MVKLATPLAAPFLRPRWLLVAALVALLSLAPQMPKQLLQQVLEQFSVPTDQKPSALKPYADLRSFRPRYQSDHQDETSVILHVTGTSIVLLLALANPELLGAGTLAIKCGLIAFDVFRHHDTGIAEALVMLGVFFATTSYLGGSVRAAIVVLFCGYLCACTGQLFFEGNSPATFIYPTYSLVCDLFMWAEVVTGATITL